MHFSPDIHQDPLSRYIHQQISDKAAIVGVIGLGYVGLPLARILHNAGFFVIGYDIDQEKVSKLGSGKSYIRHVSDDSTSKLASSDRFRASSDFHALQQCNVFIVCLPTPVGRHNEPDMTYVMDAAKDIAHSMQPGALIILESTTYPGATDSGFVEVLNNNQRRAGIDYFVAYSPEREDPGNEEFETSRIPKLVGGVDPVSGQLAKHLYTEGGFAEVVLVSSSRVAECAKLLENVYRAVNIALVNELKFVFDGMDVDIWEVLDAASSKPFGFQRFNPGPGIGGHCIPVDPFYLAWKAKESGNACSFIELAARINAGMPAKVLTRIQAALNAECKAVKEARILLVGVAYKAEVDDIRNAPALEVWNMLLDLGAQVSYHDPYVPRICWTRKHFRLAGSESVVFTSDAVTRAKYDAIVVLTNHRCFQNFDALVGFSGPVIDTRNCVTRHANLKIIQA